MTVHLSEDLEASILSLVRDGRYASVDEAMDEAARLLLRQQPAKTPMTEDELHRQMLAIGMMTQLPDRDADYDDPDDQPIDIEGEPLSETIIRARR